MRLPYGPNGRHVLRGAVNFNNLRPVAGRIEVWPGPEVPYVIPRLLEMPGMLAVISHIGMDTGYTVYPIAYSAESRRKSLGVTAGGVVRIRGGPRAARSQV
jgi:hypothetical protein